MTDALQNGALVLVVTYGREMKADKFKLTPARRLDDGQWHDVYFTKRNRQVCSNFTSLISPQSYQNVAVCRSTGVKHAVSLVRFGG